MVLLFSVFNSLNLSIPFILYYPLSLNYFLLEKVCEICHLSIIVEYSTLPMLVVVESERTNMNSTNEYLLNCYRLLKLCSPSAKLIIANITLVDLIIKVLFFSPSKNHIK